MEFRGKAKKLDDIDLPKIGRLIGVGEDELHAVLDVETRGGGFFKDGRLKMLPERHVFYRELGHGPERDAAVRRGLAYKRWGTKKYPKSSEARYKLLAEMMSINEDAALRSVSWGLGQIMGFNHRLAGYPSAKAMVEAFVDDEETHLRAMVKFIVSAGLDDELRSHDWSGFARGYNGSGYAKHGYHTKLAAAFKKWRAIPDTPFEIDRVDPEGVTDTAKVKAKQRAREGAGAGLIIVATAAANWWDEIKEAVTAKACAIQVINDFFCAGGLNL